MTDRFSGRLAHWLVNFPALAGSEERKEITTNAAKPSLQKKGKEQPMKTQISKGIMKRLALLVVPFLAVGSLTFAAPANNLATTVKGKGIVTMVATANDDVFDVFEEGDSFADNNFHINCKVNANGTANGIAHFVFGEEWSAAWGLDVMTLECEIDTGKVYKDGTVVLQGLSFEEDFVDGVVIFVEETPFEIIIDPSGSFSLRWCAIPALDLEITKGHLKVKSGCPRRR